MLSFHFSGGVKVMEIIFPNKCEYVQTKILFYFKLMEIPEKRFKHGLTIKMLETYLNKLEILRKWLKVNEYALQLNRVYDL